MPIESPLNPPFNHHKKKHPSPHGHAPSCRLKEEQELPGACIDPGGDAQDQATVDGFEMVDIMGIYPAWK